MDISQHSVRLVDFVEMAHNGNLIVQDKHRYPSWSLDAGKLLNSIAKGYPIGSFTISSEEASYSLRKQEKYEVVDGHKRLSLLTWVEACDYQNNCFHYSTSRGFFLADYHEKFEKDEIVVAYTTLLDNRSAASAVREAEQKKVDEQWVNSIKRVSMAITHYLVPVNIVTGEEEQIQDLREILNSKLT